jgi:outer membrane murein-binding lipoprotein Lpp
MLARRATFMTPGALFAALLLAGCVPASQYDNLQQAYTQLQAAYSAD